MPEPNFEKKYDGQDAEVQELKERHLEEINLLRQQNAEIAKKLIKELEVRCAEVAEGKLKHRVLVTGLLRARSNRDRVLLAISWGAIGVFAVIALGGFSSEIFSQMLTFAAAAGFIGAIICVRQSLMENKKYLEISVEGGIVPDSAWENDDGRSSRFFIFGLISAILLGLALITNFQEKTIDPVLQPQPSAVMVPKPVAAAVKTPSPSQAAKVLADVKKSDKSNNSGNGGNFTGGVSQYH